MEDIRISIRLTPEEHQHLKIIAIKKKTTMQSLLYEYIRKEIEKDGEYNENK